LHSVAHLSNWFFMMPSIATKFQFFNSLLFSFSLTTCFGPYGPSSGEIYNQIFLMDYFYYNGSVARTQFDAEMLHVTCIRNTKPKYRCTTCNISTSNCVRTTDPL
jgi:hypothetical protein